MTGRDRLVIMGIAVLAVLAAGWMLVVSPERKQAAQAQTQIESARQQLETAQAQAASERSAETRYASAYVSVVKLGKAVPPEQEVPSLVYELEQASNQRSIDFNSISSSGASTGSAGAASAGASASAASASAFTQMPFTFVFKGSFFGLAHLLGQINGFARITSTSATGGHPSTATNASTTTPTGVDVNGRLLTIQGVSLAIEGQGSNSTRPSGSEITATITATAYVLPASQGLTGGATPSGPAGAAGAASAASAAASGSPASPAVIEAKP